MCLSTAWKLDSLGEKEMLGEYISGVSVAGDTITLTDLMGNETIVKGILRGVDLIKNFITITPVENGAVFGTGKSSQVTNIFSEKEHVS
ncbi:MAG: CooT family nickel-binding protein [Treponema sp.]|jgi:predicted RNA-binding protein|nr:CooT family nickel-binding protein [Treponema sp.]